jgi:flavin-dependent dehydrogenase
MSQEAQKERIAIAGAGITGSYLYRLLKGRGWDVDLFDVGPTTKCGLHPCAWGTLRGFGELVKAAGLNAEDYVLERLDYLMMDEVRVPADLMTFDKPRFVKDLLHGATIRYSPLETGSYDRIIDATGVARAFLPSVDNDILLPCVQCQVRAHDLLTNAIRLGGIGYAWCFPLSEDRYHIGCGSLISDPRAIIKKLGWLVDGSPEPHRRIVCGCSGKIRITGPQEAQPFVAARGRAQVWGVGEAVGCVAPLTGDGIVSGMKSVRILMDHWNHPEGYTRAILEEFRWMGRERRVIDKIIKREDLGVKDAWVLMKNSKRMGMRIGLKEAMQLMKALR